MKYFFTSVACVCLCETHNIETTKSVSNFIFKCIESLVCAALEAVFNQLHEVPQIILNNQIYNWYVNPSHKN